ncbi:MAG: acyl carrier protein [Chitinispirillaceae bacterium]|nr:acyl carrier protein [Chitinispirillaceae bacterium]
MTAGEIKSRLAEMLSNEFQIDITGINPDASVFDAVSIDSITLIGIVTRMESEFAVEIPLSLIENPTLNNIIQTIARELSERPSDPAATESS